MHLQLCEYTYAKTSECTNAHTSEPVHALTSESENTHTREPANARMSVQMSIPDPAQPR